MCRWFFDMIVRNRLVRLRITITRKTYIHLLSFHDRLSLIEVMIKIEERERNWKSEQRCCWIVGFFDVYLTSTSKMNKNERKTFFFFWENFRSDNRREKSELIRIFSPEQLLTYRRQRHSHGERTIEWNDNSYGQTSTRHDIRLFHLHRSPISTVKISPSSSSLLELCLWMCTMRLERRHCDR